MSRYDPPNPKCRHARRGIVKAGEWSGAHASHAVCDRPECITDAKEWAEALVRLPAEFIPDAPAPVLCADGSPVHDFKGQTTCPACGWAGLAFKGGKQ